MSASLRASVSEWAILQLYHGENKLIFNGRMSDDDAVPITTNVVNSNPAQAIQHYVIKFVNDLRHVIGLFQVLWFPPPIKLTTTIYLQLCWKRGVKHHKQTNLSVVKTRLQSYLVTVTLATQEVVWIRCRFWKTLKIC